MPWGYVLVCFWAKNLKLCKIMPWGYVLFCFQHYKHHQRYQHTRLANMQIRSLGARLVPTVNLLEVGTT